MRNEAFFVRPRVPIDRSLCVDLSGLSFSSYWHSAPPSNRLDRFMLVRRIPSGTVPCTSNNTSWSSLLVSDDPRQSRICTAQVDRPGSARLVRVCLTSSAPNCASSDFFSAFRLLFFSFIARLAAFATTFLFAALAFLSAFLTSFASLIAACAAFSSFRQLDRRFLRFLQLDRRLNRQGPPLHTGRPLPPFFALFRSSRSDRVGSPACVHPSLVIDTEYQPPRVSSLGST